ncbi:MAG: hypothetical protein PVH19_07550, partial [Planctomycetia bacterium]
MRISDRPPIDLTYCLNVHPGETWEQQFEAIREYTLPIRDRVTASRADRRFGLGLRLSDLSAQQLLGGKRGLAPFAESKGACPLFPALDEEAEKKSAKKGTGTFSRAEKTSQSPFSIEAFKEFLAEEDLYVFTVNGFPFGQFHQTVVKDRVYRPDWAQSARREYTETIARVLVELIDKGATASISTAPLTFKGWPEWEQGVAPGLRQLAETAYTLWLLYQETGRRVVLALEPEPYCYPETMSEMIEVFDILRHDVGPAVLEQHGVSRSDAAQILQKHIGVCFDTAHQAVEFEDLTAGLQSLLDAHVPIAKVQLSAALEVDPTVAPLESLARFADRTYLHQTNIHHPDGTLDRYADLPEGKGDWLVFSAREKVPVPFSGPTQKEASEGAEIGVDKKSSEERAAEAEKMAEKKGTGTFSAKTSQSPFSLRIHYHWPLYQPTAGPGISSTSHLLLGDFARLLRTSGCPHWEIETYTW